MCILESASTFKSYTGHLDTPSPPPPPPSLSLYMYCNAMYWKTGWVVIIYILLNPGRKHVFFPEPGKKTRGRPPKERSNPAEGYDSAIACHLAANKTRSRRYEVGDFSVLTRARTKNHLNVLEAVYISVLNHVLCKQKSFVTSLTLFQRTQRTHPP